jgi:hypothetical protein
MALRLANHFTPSPRKREDGKSFALFAESFANLAIKVFKVLTAKNAKSARAQRNRAGCVFRFPLLPLSVNAADQ